MIMPDSPESAVVGQKARTASPANFIMSPPGWLMMPINFPKYPLRTEVSSSIPLGPMEASRSVRGVKPLRKREREGRRVARKIPDISKHNDSRKRLDLWPSVSETDQSSHQAA